MDAVQVAEEADAARAAHHRRGDVKDAQWQMKTDGSAASSHRACGAAVSVQPSDLRGQRSVGDRGRHRVRHRRQGRSVVQRGGVERHEVRRDRQVCRTAATAASRASASCFATSSRARRSTSSRPCARLPSGVRRHHRHRLRAGADSRIGREGLSGHPVSRSSTASASCRTSRRWCSRSTKASYLVGILAAMTSKTGTLGFLGGMDIGLIHRFAQGLRGGRAIGEPEYPHPRRTTSG